MLKCPHCNEELKTIHVYYEASDVVDVTGEVICSRTAFNSGWDTLLDAECPNCEESIGKFLEKNAPDFPAFNRVNYAK